MKHFLERIFYGEKTDTVYSLSFAAYDGGVWVLEWLPPSGNWCTLLTAPSYEEGLAMIRAEQPVLLCEELL